MDKKRLGVDLAKWDGGEGFSHTLNWPQYDWGFSFIKCSQGTVIDPLFKKQWAAAKGHVYRGAYHFFDPRIDPRASAEKFLEYLAGDIGELPLILDLEVFYGLSNESICSKSKMWLNIVHTSTGIIPIVYSRIELLKSLNYFASPEFQKYPLWIAEYHYDNYPVAERKAIIESVLDGSRILVFPQVPRPFELSFYQWTEFGSPTDVPGYYINWDGKDQVDLNLYNGPFQDMINRFHLPALPAPDNGDTMPIVTGTGYVKPAPNELEARIRSNTNTGSSILKVLKPGETFKWEGEPIISGYTWYTTIEPVRGFIADTETVVIEPPSTELPPPTPTTPAPKPVKQTIEFDDGTKWVSTTFVKQ